MIDQSALLHLTTHALQRAHFVERVKLDTVRMDLGTGGHALAQLVGELGFSEPAGRGDMDNQFIHFQRIVVAFAQLDLPGFHLRAVVEDVLEFVEVNEGAFDFIHAHLADFSAARDVAEKPRHAAAAGRAGRAGHSTINDVTRAITEHDGAACVERSEDEFAG